MQRMYDNLLKRPLVEKTEHFHPLGTVQIVHFWDWIPNCTDLDDRHPCGVTMPVPATEECLLSGADNGHS